MEKGAAETREQAQALFESISYLWKHKFHLLGGTFVFGMAGFIYCMLATPVFKSDALIAPKEEGPKVNAAGLLSQFGNLGGMVASQIGFGNNGLERMEVLLKSRALTERLIRERNLLPVLFPKRWDETRNAWRQGTDSLFLLRQGIEILRQGILDVSTNPKKNMLTIEVRFRDSLMAAKIAGYYIEGLNDKIRMDVVSEADTNKGFLEKQLASTTDPLLREKLQQLMSTEIEKSMLVSSRAFEVLEEPQVPLFRDKPKRKVIMAFYLILGAACSILFVFLKRNFNEVKAKLALASVKP